MPNVWPNVPYPQMISFCSETFRGMVKFPAQARSPNENRRIAEQARSKARELAGRAFDNINARLPFVYFTAGVTEGIAWSLRNRKVNVLRGEYRFLMSQPNVSTLKEGDTSKPLFISSPFSGDGKHVDLPKFKDQESLIVDASYLFASNMSHLTTLPSNVETVLLGVSKSHDLADFRFGIMFSRQEVPGHHVAQYEYGYINGATDSILDALLSKELNHLYRLNKNRVESAYKESGLEVSDTLVFAVDREQGRRVPWYWVLG